MNAKTKYYPPLKPFDKSDSVSSYIVDSPWPKSNTSFYWVNFDFPMFHTHKDWELLIVLKGSIVHIIDDTTTTLHVGDACLIGPMNTHALFFKNNENNQFQGLTILARDSYMKDVLNLYSPSLYNDLTSSQKPLHFSLSGSFIESLDDDFFEIQTMQHKHKAYCEKRCNILFHSILTKFLSHESTNNSIPKTILDFIRRLNNPSLSSADIKQLQEEQPYSYPQLAKLFKKYTGMTITQYVNNIKMEYSKELLETTNLTTLAISSKLSFDSLSHFNHLFKKHYNTTPSSHRKSFTNQD